MLIPKHVFPVAKFCDASSTRYALGAVCVERIADDKVSAIATDGKRLIVTSWDDSDRAEYPSANGKLNPSETVGDFTALVARSHWNEAAQAIRKVKTHKPILHHVVLDEAGANGTVSLSTYDCETVRAIESRVIEGRFPNWRDALKTYETVDSKALQSASEKIREAGLVLSGAVENRAFGFDTASELAEQLATVAASLESYSRGAARITLDAKLLAETAQVVSDSSGPIDSRCTVELAIPVDPNCAALVSATGKAESEAVIMPMASK